MSEQNKEVVTSTSKNYNNKDILLVASVKNKKSEMFPSQKLNMINNFI